MPKMSIYFDGLMRLLSESLYPTKTVFIREMIQNSHDSIARRRFEDAAAGGRIDVESAPTERRLTFTDNGIGMDQEDLIKFLSTIAAGATRISRDLGGIEELIGQHGIGFLSAFLVAKKVVVKTRKFNTTSGWQWSSSGNDEYEILPLEVAETGTRVDIYLRDNEDPELLNEGTIRDVIVTYANYLAIPIHINGSRVPANAMQMPWDREYRSQAEREATYRLFIEALQRDSVLEAIPFQLEKPIRARGTLYVTKTRVFVHEAPRDVRLYQSRMLLTDRAESLLPRWARFVNGIIDSQDIKPNTARDNYVEDAQADSLREALGKIVIDYLDDLYERNPQRFRLISRYHELSFHSAAYYNSEFFDKYYHLLLWRTNNAPFETAVPEDADDEDLLVPWDDAGRARSLNEILDKLAPGAEAATVTVPAVFDPIAARQFFEIADAAGTVVIDAGRIFAAELLKRIEQKGDPSRFRGRRIQVESVDLEGGKGLFRPASRPEDEPVRALTTLLQEVIVHQGTLSHVKVEPVIVKPESVLGIVRASGRAVENLQNALQKINDPEATATDRAMARDYYNWARRAKTTLLLNACNPLVLELAKAWQTAGVEGRQHEPAVREEIISFALPIYNIALLNSGSRLSENTQQLVAAQFTNVLHETLTQRTLLNAERSRAAESSKAAESRVQFLQARLDNLKPRSPAKPRTHVSFFYITPFAQGASGVREAVRTVVEDFWNCALQMASDQQLSNFLLENVRSMIVEADGFIADITGLNANVLFELGAVLFDGRDRPIILLGNFDSSQQVPADLSGLIRIHYADRSGQDLIAHLDREMRKATGVEALLQKPRRQKVISRQFLENTLNECGVNTAVINLEAVVQSLRTSELWKAATEEEVAKLLPAKFARQAAIILDAMRHAVQRG